MNVDTRIADAEKGSLAAGARQYVLKVVQSDQEAALTNLEALLGAGTISVEKTFVTLGGIMAMRRLLRVVERDIKKGQQAQAPPSR